MSEKETIRLKPQTLASHDAFCRELVQDPMLFADPANYVPYRYDAEQAALEYARNQERTDRRYYTVFLGSRPIGELVLKKIDPVSGSCEFGICLANDSMKNHGYGTQAEKLALEIAFDQMRMKTVYADTLIRNERSQHVLRKIGFEELREQDGFRYFGMTKEQYEKQNGRETL